MDTTRTLLRNATSVYRQGELLFVPDPFLNGTELEPCQTTVIRRGSTGGSHVVPAKMLLRGREGTCQRWATRYRWVAATTVTHRPSAGTAHRPLTLPATVANFYRVVIQREGATAASTSYVRD